MLFFAKSQGNKWLIFAKSQGNRRSFLLKSRVRIHEKLSQSRVFCNFATGFAKEIIIKGYVLDEERLKQGKHFGKDCFAR